MAGSAIIGVLQKNGKPRLDSSQGVSHNVSFYLTSNNLSSLERPGVTTKNFPVFFCLLTSVCCPPPLATNDSAAS